MTSREDLLSAAETIVSAADKPSLRWAVNYATHLALMIRHQAPEHDLRIQCRSILTNIEYWRGAEAARSRRILRDFCARKPRH